MTLTMQARELLARMKVARSSIVQPGRVVWLDAMGKPVKPIAHGELSAKPLLPPRGATGLYMAASDFDVWRGDETSASSHATANVQSG